MKSFCMERPYPHETHVDVIYRGFCNRYLNPETVEQLENKVRQQNEQAKQIKIQNVSLKFIIII